MAASETENQRKLRRVALDLAACAIEDVESVWAALSKDEQAQLQPLLAEATQVGGAGFRDQFAVLEVDAAQAAAGSGQARSAQQLAGLMATVPKELAARLLFSFEPAVAAQISAALPDERNRLLQRVQEQQPDGRFSMTAAARQMLRDAGLALARDVELAPEPPLRQSEGKLHSRRRWRDAVPAWLRLRQQARRR